MKLPATMSATKNLFAMMIAFYLSRLTRFQVSDRPFPFESVPACLNVSPSISTVNCRRRFYLRSRLFGVGTPVQNVCSTACIKQLPFLRIVSSKNEVPSRNDLDISFTFWEFLTGDQLPGTIQLTLLCLAAVCL